WESSAGTLTCGRRNRGTRVFVAPRCPQSPADFSLAFPRRRVRVPPRGPESICIWSRIRGGLRRALARHHASANAEPFGRRLSVPVGRPRGPGRDLPLPIRPGRSGAVPHLKQSARPSRAPRFPYGLSAGCAGRLSSLRRGKPAPSSGGVFCPRRPGAAPLVVSGRGRGRSLRRHALRLSSSACLRGRRGGSRRCARRRSSGRLRDSSSPATTFHRGPGVGALVPDQVRFGVGGDPDLSARTSPLPRRLPAPFLHTLAGRAATSGGAGGRFHAVRPEVGLQLRPLSRRRAPDGSHGSARAREGDLHRLEGAASRSTLVPERVPLFLSGVLRPRAARDPAFGRSARHRLEVARHGRGSLRLDRGAAPPLADAPSLVPHLGSSLRGMEAQRRFPLSLHRRRARLPASLPRSGRDTGHGPRGGVPSFWRASALGFSASTGRLDCRVSETCRYRAVLAYVGTHFSGWQTQKNAPRTV